MSSLQRSRLELERQHNIVLIEQLREQLAEQKSRSEEAATLEGESVAIQSLEPLTLPIRQPLTTEPLNSDQVLAPMELMPQLTGVVQGPDGNSSAIIGLGPSSASAGIGDAIGNSGWVLTAVTESGAVISRNGQSQTLSVGGLF